MTEVGERVSSGLSACPFSSEEFCLSHLRTSDEGCKGRSSGGKPRSAILARIKPASCDRWLGCQCSASAVALAALNILRPCAVAIETQTAPKISGHSTIRGVLRRFFKSKQKERISVFSEIWVGFARVGARCVRDRNRDRNREKRWFTTWTSTRPNNVIFFFYVELPFFY